MDAYKGSFIVTVLFSKNIFAQTCKKKKYSIQMGSLSYKKLIQKASKANAP